MGGLTVTTVGLVSVDAAFGNAVSASLDAGTYDLAQPDFLDAAFTSDGPVYGTVEAELTVDPAALSVVADDQSKVYGEADPLFTFTVSGFQLTDNESLLSGALGRQAGENVGSYAIMQGNLDAGDNYVIDVAAGGLTIVPRPITIAAADQQKLAVQQDPALTWSITQGSLVNGDSVSGSLTRAAGEDVGFYPILQGSLEVSSNYAMSFVPGLLIIHPELPDGESGFQRAPLAGFGGGTDSAGGDSGLPVTAPGEGDREHLVDCGPEDSEERCPAIPYPGNRFAGPLITFGAW